MRRAESERPRVLVIENDAAAREALVEVLAGAGYDVVAAIDGSEGLGQLSHGFRPAAILLDLLMPGIDGWDFRAYQKRNPLLAAIPVITMSAAGKLVDADYELQKPIDVQELLMALRRIVDEGPRSAA